MLEVHDLHIWGMSTTEAALTAHLVRDVPTCDDALMARASRELHDRFGIEHAPSNWKRATPPMPARKRWRRLFRNQFRDAF